MSSRKVRRKTLSKTQAKRRYGRAVRKGREQPMKFARRTRSASRRKKR